jgi:predicted nucleic acid-binding protein
MVVIANTSPLNYLVLIDQIDLLPRLFTEVVVPDAVLGELSRSEAPPPVARWVASPPGWVRRVADPPLRHDPVLDTLGMGERAAISFAETLRPDVLLVIDESRGRRAAVERQIPVVGILGILEVASVQGWVNLPYILASLRRTNFRVAPDLIESLLERDGRRKAAGSSFKETEK